MHDSGCEDLAVADLLRPRRKWVELFLVFSPHGSFLGAKVRLNEPIEAHLNPGVIE